MPKTKALLPPPTIGEPSPMIIIQPANDGFQLNAYGLASGEIVDALRLALLHIVATLNGANVVQATFGRQTAVAVHSNSSDPGKASKPVITRQRRRLPVERIVEDEDLDS